MNDNEPTTIVSIASVLGRVIDHYGLDKIEIAKSVGLNVDKAYKPNDRVSSATLQKIWKITEQQTADDSLGITYAKFLQPASLCGLGLAWITSDSLKDAINRLVRFQHAVTTNVDFKLNELNDCYQIVLTHKNKTVVNSSIDASIAVLFRMCRIAFGPELKPEKVTIAHKKPKKHKIFDDFFVTKVEFNAPVTQLIFAKNIFEKKLTSANPDLARMSDQVVIEYLQQFDKGSLSMQVRAGIVEELNNGVPNQEKIASSLNMSLRNLQRKLKDEGTNFKSILDETRSELSKQYLRGSHRSILEVGFLLGFSESSNFSRAFRRWTGLSPQEYRDAPQ